MHKLVGMLLLLAPIGLFAQEAGKFKITGNLQGFHEKLVYLVYLMKDGQRVTDSCQVKNDGYYFKGSIDHSGLASLDDTDLCCVMQNNNFQIYLEPGSFTITHIGSFTNARVAGSKLNMDLNAQRHATALYGAAVGPLFLRRDSAKEAGNDSLAGRIDSEKDSLYNVFREEVYGKYVRKEPHSPLALRALMWYAGLELDPEKIRPLFETLSEEARNSNEGKMLRKRIELAEKTAIGMDAIDITQNDTAGVPVRLSSFRGKYVLLCFWASSSPPCREEDPNLVEAYRKYHAKGLEIVSVSLDKAADKDKWLMAIRDDGLNWTHMSDLKFWDNAAARTYGVERLPGNYLIDPNWKIVGKNLKGETLEKKLMELF